MYETETTGLHSSDYYNCVCPQCGVRFHLKPCAVKKSKEHYCSKKCFYESKKISFCGENNHQYGLKGSKNSSWKSDRKVSQYGYIMVRCLDHPFREKDGFVFEHRLVAEENLLTDENSIEIDGKRYLKPDYCVHHKDFNRVNNSVENLVVMKKEEHQSFHAKLNKPKRDPITGRFAKIGKDEIRVKKVTETAKLPTRSTDGSAGYDLYVDTDHDVVIHPHTTVMLQSNIALSIPKGYFGAIYARSGISTKRGLRPSTCVSVIDSDYRGSIGLPIYNDSNEDQTVKPMERVAQIVFHKAVYFELNLVDELDDTERGDGGFGSTGR